MFQHAFVLMDMGVIHLFHVNGKMNHQPNVQSILVNQLRVVQIVNVVL